MIYFIVTTTYYKHGEFETFYFDDEKIFIDFIEKNVIEQSILIDSDDNVEEIKKLSLLEKISKCINDGDYIVNNELGYGIREVTFINNGNIHILNNFNKNINHIPN